MFSTLRNRFGIPGVISVIALVFAMFGGAYAASNSSGGGKATVSAKAKKGPKGPKGAKGDTGPAGPQGPAGPVGAAGPKGDAGAPGSSGTNGVGVTTSAAGAECPAGGIKVTSASGATKVCNGEEGLQGQEGSPWTLGGTLPSKQTETGSYLIASETGSGTYVGYAVGNISFPIPLPAGLPEDHLIYVSTPGAPPEECENPEHAGTAGNANPEADPGYLCVFMGLASHLNESTMEFISPNTGVGAGVSGVLLAQHPTTEAAENGEPALGVGVWAVTAP